MLLFGTTCLRFTFTLREQLLVDDSGPFKVALEAWSSMIHRAYPSPRGVKRFLNKARFIAMRQRGISDVDPVPSIERFSKYLASRWLWLCGRGSDLHEATRALGEQRKNDDRERIAEDIIVALATLESDPKAWSLLLGTRDSADMPEAFLSYLQEVLPPDDSKSIAFELSRIWREVTRLIDPYCQIIQPGAPLKNPSVAPAE